MTTITKFALLLVAAYLVRHFFGVPPVWVAGMLLIGGLATALTETRSGSQTPNA